MRDVPQNEFDPGPTVAPLGAGDLVDRAVRFYRQKFWTFIFIASPPVVAGLLILVFWTYIARNYFYVGANGEAFANTAYYIFVWLGGTLIRFIEIVAILSVIGGASRNFVRHLLFGEDVSFRNTYLYIRQHIWTLIAGSTIVAGILSISGLIVFYIGVIVAFLGIAIVVGFLNSVAPLAFVIGTAILVATIIGTGWLFFLIASRFAYVPQSITVEGRGVFGALSRSMSLASGNVKRFAALFVFTFAAIYSALAILYVPLGWYAWYKGVQLGELFRFDPDLIPAWYEIGSQFVGQLSVILLSPVWMIGSCLLYVDERVRHEGYDIEMMASQRLGEIPDVPQDYINPLQPALGAGMAIVPVAPAPAPGSASRSTSTLGLLD